METILDDIEDIQFWTKPAKKMPTDIMVPPDSLDDVREFLREKGLEYEMLIHDVQVSDTKINCCKTI